ncbi:MAG: helix-turn-helix domain-containing protein [Nitrospirota bacterium]
MTERLITVDEVAEMLGFTTQGVYSLVFKKKIPAVKISKRALRFRPSDIEAWLQEKTQQPVQAAISQQPARKSPGRPRKNGTVRNDYVNHIIESAKKEVLNV